MREVRNCRPPLILSSAIAGTSRQRDTPVISLSRGSEWVNGIDYRAKILFLNLSVWLQIPGGNSTNGSSWKYKYVDCLWASQLKFALCSSNVLSISVASSDRLPTTPMEVGRPRPRMVPLDPDRAPRADRPMELPLRHHHDLVWLPTPNMTPPAVAGRTTGLRKIARSTAGE